MEKKKNIIYITGTDNYGCMLETSRLIRAFRERQDSQNIDTYHLADIKDWNTIRQDMNTMSLFAEKRLFIFRGEIKAKSEDADETGEKDKKIKLDEILIEICEDISDDTFIIFDAVILSPKSKLLAWLGEHADIRRYETLWDVEIWQGRYPSLTRGDIEAILTRYRQSLTDTSVTYHIGYILGGIFDKLSLIRISRALTTEDYETSFALEASGKMFDLIDVIMRADSERGLSLFHRIIDTMNIYAFMASFIGLMRTSVYIRYLKHHHKTQNEITKIIPAHPYVIQKAYDARISYDTLYRFYDKILSINKAYRSGKGKKNPELGIIFDIELAIMGLKK